MQHPCRSTRRFIFRASVVTAVLATALLLVGGDAVRAAGDHSALDSDGPVAGTIERLWWVLFAISALVVVAVTAILVIGVLRKPPVAADVNPAAPPRATANDDRIVALGGIVIPAAILVAVFAYTLRDMSSLAEPDHPAAVTVEVTGYQWWWGVRYPDQGITTANEIHVPTGEPVEVKLTTADVIHSFWVPNLTSKRDLIPGHTNKLWFQADTPGTYRGECAEYCGTEHALMAFLVIAEPPDQYAAWVANQQQASVQPTDQLLVEGQQAFLGAACVYCHTVAGTNASGKIGPDLTHIASRQTLAAGTIANTKGNLAGWILNPQAIKPGNHMPATRMDSNEFQALLAYLESLK